MAEDGNDIPSMVGYLYTMTVLLYENERLTEAEQKLDQSRKMLESASIPDGIKNNLERGYWYQKARLALKKGQVEEAGKYAENYRDKAELTENRIQMMYYYTLSAMIANAEKDFSRAISEFEKTNLDDPFNRYQLAQTYIQKEEKNKAIEELDFVVNYNGLSGLSYTMVRGRAEKQLVRLKMD
jgi:tetratricopeptide (TPR) repeat protein